MGGVRERRLSNGDELGTRRQVDRGSGKARAAPHQEGSGDDRTRGIRKDETSTGPARPRGAHRLRPGMRLQRRTPAGETPSYDSPSARRETLMSNRYRV